MASPTNSSVALPNDALAGSRAVRAPLSITESPLMGRRRLLSYVPSVELPNPLPVSQKFSDLLSYLTVGLQTFSEHEDAYFKRLGELLEMAGVLSAGETVDRTNFDTAVAQYQSEAKLGTPDGIPGENTLWALQHDWAAARELAKVTVDADVWLPPGVTNHKPHLHGFETSQVRQDTAILYQLLHDEMRRYGAPLTSAGGFRSLSDAVGPGRSKTSLHYTGLAFDLALPTGMQDPENDPFLIENDGGRYWQVWARSEHGGEREIKAIRVKDKKESTITMTAKVVDFTHLAWTWGFDRIGRRSTYPSVYPAAEWWHFQAGELLVPWISQFGIELLSVDEYNESDLASSYASVWKYRRRIYKRGRNGWH